MSSGEIPTAASVTEDWGGGPDDSDPAFDTSIAHHARIYDYILGGKDNYPADRAQADALIAAYPKTVTVSRANRAFLGRAVRFLAADAGVDQFLDIGPGLPSPGNAIEVARTVRPDSRIVSVDHDPVVLSHARALLAPEDAATAYIDADFRDPGSFLEQAAATLDFTRPVGVLMLFLLHALLDSDNPHRVVTAIMDAMPAGSYLVISHSASDLLDPDAVEELTSIANTASAQQYMFRDRNEIGRFFDGLELTDPGLVPLEKWRPAPDTPDDITCVWAGVARKLPV